MKTLEKHTIVYDDSCPMCNIYTSAFIKHGLLDEEGRKGFAEVDAKILACMDKDRCRHEIPLVNRETGETIYGIDALCLILGNRWNWMKPLFGFKIFRFFLYQLYQIITYNRRIIAGSKRSETGFDCTPDYHVGYRLLYLLLAGIAIYALGTDFHFTFRDTPHYYTGIFSLAILSLPIVTGLLWKNDILSTLGHIFTVFLLLGIISKPFVWLENSNILPDWANLLAVGITAVPVWVHFGKRI